MDTKGHIMAIISCGGIEIKKGNTLEGIEIITNENPDEVFIELPNVTFSPGGIYTAAKKTGGHFGALRALASRAEKIGRLIEAGEVIIYALISSGIKVTEVKANQRQRWPQDLSVSEYLHYKNVFLTKFPAGFCKEFFNHFNIKVPRTNEDSRDALGLLMPFFINRKK